MKKKTIIPILSVVIILLVATIISVSRQSGKKQLEPANAKDVSVQAGKKEAEKDEVVKNETIEDDKAGKVIDNKKESNLSDKNVLSIVNNAQESFYKVTRSVEAVDNYGIFNEEFNSPEKLQKYLNIYWTKRSSKELMNSIGAKYINNKYSITLGDAPYIEIMQGEVIKKRQEKDRIYLTIKAYCVGETDNFNFELKFEDNKWVVDYYEGSFGVIGKREEVKSKETKNKETQNKGVQNNEVKNKVVTADKAVEMVWNIVPNKAANTVLSFDREEVRDGAKYFVIHAYDNMSTHVATRGWYYVGSKDGKVYEWDLVTDKLKLVQ